MNNFYDIDKTNVTDTDFPETEKGRIKHPVFQPKEK